jgi:hypothetical protein
MSVRSTANLATAPALVLVPPGAAPAVEDAALLHALRAALDQPWKTDVMNRVGCVLRDAFTAISFGFKACVTYAPLIRERQVACLWALELNDDVALAAAAEEAAGSGAAPREIANLVTWVKLVFRKVDQLGVELPDGASAADGVPAAQLRCSLSFLVPGLTPGAPRQEADLACTYLPLAGRTTEELVAAAIAAMQQVLEPGEAARLGQEAERMAHAVLQGLAP